MLITVKAQRFQKTKIGGLLTCNTGLFSIIQPYSGSLAAIYRKTNIKIGKFKVIQSE